MDKRAKSTQPNISPGSSAQQNVKNASRPTSPRGRSPSEKMDVNFGDKCSYAHRQVDEQPSKKSKKNGDRICSGYIEEYTTIGLRLSGYGAAKVFNDFTEELRHTETGPMCKIRKSRCTSR